MIDQSAIGGVGELFLLFSIQHSHRAREWLSNKRQRFAGHGTWKKVCRGKGKGREDQEVMKFWVEFQFRASSAVQCSHSGG